MDYHKPEHSYQLNMSDSIDKASIIPVYYQLAKLLEYKIRLGEVRAGEKLPPENELAEKYNISRMTVRRAIAELVTKGIVSPEKGRGTFVNAPNVQNSTFELTDFISDMHKRGLNPSFKLIEAKILKADQDIANKLKVPTGTRHIFFRSILSANDEPLVYDLKSLPYNKQTPILENLYDPSLQNMITNNADFQMTKSLNTLKVAMLTHDEALILNVPANLPAFQLEKVIYDQHDKPIGYGKSLYRGDRYQITSRGGTWF